MAADCEFFMDSDRPTQRAILHRSVGPWVSHFESCTCSSSDKDDRTDNVGIFNNYTRNSQGLIVRKKCHHKRKRKRKRKKLDKGSNSCNKFRYDPSNDKKIEGDPHKTVFIARLDFSTTEETLSYIFGKFGSIKSLRLVKDTESGKSKGYAFVEFLDEGGAKTALRETKDERLLVDCRKVLVDRVRAGVIPSWLPRRLGGGLGQRQKGTQRFSWKLPYFGDSSRIDQEDIYRKQQMWLEHNR